MSEAIITDIAQLKAESSWVIDVPSYDGTSTYKFRVKSPSIIACMAEGRIPNALIPIVEKTINAGKPEKKAKATEPDIPDYKTTSEYMLFLCEQALVEPTYAELKENGIELTTEQITAIVDGSQKAVSDLSSFRK